MVDVSATVDRLAATTSVKFAIAVLAGLGVGGVASPSPVTLPVIGTTSTLYVGTFIALVAVALFVGLTRYSGSDCGCSEDCDC